MTDETIFAVALEKPNLAERVAYLDSACEDDPGQRKRIEGLLAALSKAGSFLEKPAVEAADSDFAPTRAFRAAGADPGDGPSRTHGEEADDTTDALSFLTPPGRPDSLGRIGHYEVLEVLGRGGFGIVFRAFDDVLQRVVAVKVLSPSMAATSPARKRFLREARSAAPIQHENVVRIHETREEPLPFLVMEFVSGETLQQKLDCTGPLEVSESIRIAQQVAEGLAAAHAEGLVHRDIKPSNILIENGPQACVKITDFGLARAADDASLTRSGVVAGTPMYMAPEQAKGETLDHRADLFSLGSVFYAMLTGHPPFRAETTLAVLKRVAEDDPRPIREVIPEVPEWLCRIVEKLHAKNPAERFQTAREVADLLSDCEKQLAAHKELTDMSRIPEAKERAVGRPLYRRFAIGLCFVAVLFWSAILFGEPSYRYVANRGAIEVLPETGLASVIVWKDGTAVTDWYDARSRPTISLPSGKYKLEPGFAPGWTISHWEVTTHGLFSSHTFLNFDRAPEFEVPRGQDVTVRAVMREDPSTAPPSPKSDDGWVSLFNGKDLTGWHGTQDKYFVTKDGTLLANPVSKEYGMLRTVKSYENYELQMQCRVAGAGDPGSKTHAGVALHVVNNEDVTTPTDGAYIWIKAGRAPDMEGRGIGDVGEIKTAQQSKGPAAPPWNELRVVCQDRRITVFYNGEERWSCSRCSRDKGEIGLWTEEGDAYFRKIEIKELPSSDPKAPHPAKKSQPNPAVIQPLRDAVSAKARVVEDVKKRFEAGTANKLELLAAQVDLREADIKLAEAEGDMPILILHLRALVKLREEERELIAIRVEVGVERVDALNQADARLADVRARFAKLKPPAVAPPPREKP